MADENLTVLLRLKADVADIKAALQGVAKEEQNVGKVAKEVAAHQEGMFSKIGDGLQKVRAGFGGFMGTLNVAKVSFGFLGDAADAFAKKNEEQGKAWRAARKEWDEATDKLKEAIGSIVVALAPLLSALSKIVGFVSDVVSVVGGAVGAVGDFIFGSGGGPADPGRQTANAALPTTGNPQADVDAAQALQNQAAIAFNAAHGQGSGFTTAQIQADWERMPSTVALRAAQSRLDAAQSSLGDAVQEETTAYYVESARLKKEAARLKKEAARLAAQKHNDAIPDINAEAFQAANDLAFGAAPAAGVQSYRKRQLRGGRDSFDTSEAADLVAQLEKMKGELTAGATDIGVVAGQQSYLEKLFGPVDQFDVYAEGFNILSGAMQGAFDAWVDGSLSASQAMKKFVGDALKGVASTMFGEAIKHGAFAIGDLAFGNFAGAALHAKSALAFGAGAIAVGGLARAYGGGGGGSSATAGGGGGTPNYGGGGGSAGGSQGSQISIYLGDYFATNNPRTRNGDVARAIRSARKELDDGGGVRFS